MSELPRSLRLYLQAEKLERDAGEMLRRATTLRAEGLAAWEQERDLLEVQRLHPGARPSAPSPSRRRSWAIRMCGRLQGRAASTAADSRTG